MKKLKHVLAVLSVVMMLSTTVVSLAYAEDSAIEEDLSTEQGDIQGDANGDGVLNVRDAAFIAQALAQGKASDLPDSADYNGDGAVNVRDAAAIAKYLASTQLTDVDEVYQILLEAIEERGIPNNLSIMDNKVTYTVYDYWTGENTEEQVRQIVEEKNISYDVFQFIWAA